MLMNYHEMTMNEPRDSPEKRKQFLVICTVMAGALFHSFFSAGGLSPIIIEDGTFPGGDFVYKTSKRDYAACGSLERSIAKQDAGVAPKNFIDRIYSLYLDDTDKLSGRQLRFASGLLINEENGHDPETKSALLAKNEGKVPPTEEEILDISAVDLWPRLVYRDATLPKVKAATVQFSYTGGFVSSLILTMRILPALRKYAKEHSSTPNAITILSTCSEMDQVCTHYAPLEQGQVFLLGQPDTETYRQELPGENLFKTDGIVRTAKRSIQKYVGLAPKNAIVDNDDDQEPKIEKEKSQPTKVTKKSEDSSSTEADTTEPASDAETNVKEEL